jgi:RNA polymerase sigma-70 factor (ECF subfamily)
MLMTQLKVSPHQWVELYADYLYAYTITRIGDGEQARDLVQDTFLAALERIDKFEGKCSEKSWLTAILKNKIFDVYRNRSKQCVELFEEDMRFFDPELHNWKKESRPEPFGIEQGDPLQNKELKVVLQNCLQKLPPLWLAVFSRKHIDDESTQTICSELNISDANFWVIIHRSKVNLRALLQKNWLE